LDANEPHVFNAVILRRRIYLNYLVEQTLLTLRAYGHSPMLKS
jgi:hypothetical protein